MTSVRYVAVSQNGLVNIGPVGVFQWHTGKTVHLGIHKCIILVRVSRIIIVRSIKTQIIAYGNVSVDLEVKPAPEIILVVVVGTDLESPLLMFIST